MKLDRFNSLLKLWATTGALAALYLAGSFSGAFKTVSPVFTGPNTNFYRAIATLLILSFLIAWSLRKKIERALLWLINDFHQVQEKMGVEPIEFDTTRLNLALLMAGAAIGLYSIYLAVTDVSAYWRLIDEDGFIEYVSFWSWALAAGLSTISFFLKRDRFNLNRFIYIPLIACFALCGGEEISWGQRIVASEDSEVLLQINKQHELNLHNIGSISFYENAFFFMTLTFFLLLPYLMKRYKALNNYITYHDFPTLSPFTRRIFFFGLAVWAVVGIRFGTLGFHPFSLWGYYTQMDDEIFEFFAAYSFFSFALLDLACRLKRRATLETHIAKRLVCRSADPISRNAEA